MYVTWIYIIYMYIYIYMCACVDILTITKGRIAVTTKDKEEKKIHTYIHIYMNVYIHTMLSVQNCSTFFFYTYTCTLQRTSVAKPAGGEVRLTPLRTPWLGAQHFPQQQGHTPHKLGCSSES